jgi:hypothetical protein
MSTSELGRKAPAEQAAWAAPKVRYLILGVLVGCALSIPCVEIVLRLLGEHTTSNLVGLYQPFGRNGYKLSPNFRGDTNQLVGRFSVLTNDLGLRCGKNSRRSGTAEGAKGILVLGASQVYGDGLNYEDSLVGHLASLAGERGLAVNNAGVGGHYLENQFELTQWLYDRGVRPTHIIVLLDPYLIATAGSYNQAYVGSDGVLYEKESASRHRLTFWLKRHTVTYARVRNAIIRLQPNPKTDLTSAVVRLYSKAEEDGYRERTLQFLKHLSAWCDERHIAIMLVYDPGVVEFTFDPVVRLGRSAGVDVDRNVPYRAASSAAASLSIPFQDSRPAIERESLNGQPLALWDGWHYSAPVSATVARSIWEGITSAPSRVDVH